MIVGRERRTCGENEASHGACLADAVCVDGGGEVLYESCYGLGRKWVRCHVLASGHDLCKERRDIRHNAAYSIIDGHTSGDGPARTVHIEMYGLVGFLCFEK